MSVTMKFFFYVWFQVGKARRAGKPVLHRITAESLRYFPLY
jgi:hypothetical protein